MYISFVYITLNKYLPYLEGVHWAHFETNRVWTARCLDPPDSATKVNVTL